MQPAKSLREKLGNQELVLGMIVTDHLWPQLVEIAMGSGLDYLIIGHGASTTFTTSGG